MNEHHDREIICPYCDAEYQESFLLQDESPKCEACGKWFELQVSIETTYHTYTNCELNGEEHDWEESSCTDLCVSYKCSKCIDYKHEAITNA